ncbi:hypothetical protein FF38_10043 [Lucilia cuprina]|uniref:HAT C-terminal dimerisation domain-containing protein n=1 Tax=Lucilia cuprina TaxID=7375 RepID=A0A0L0BMP4_LUCCU|nr:hypothetical protein FF38_10043 [Lucilia cuprina]
MTEFLGILVVEEATAVALYESLREFLKRNRLSISNLVVIGTDGANRENIDLYSGYEHLVLLFMSICSKIIKPEFIENCADKMNIIIKNEDCYLDVDDIEVGIECSEELKSLPLSDFKNIKNKFESVYGILKNSMDDEIPISTYENQWNKLQHIDWQKHTNNNIPKDIFGFWAIVYEYEDNAGNYYFRELANAVFHLLVIPITNAFVKRIFSCMNTTKTKLRNKMQHEMLESLIRIKSYLNNYNICCYKFEVPESMVFCQFKLI